MALNTLYPASPLFKVCVIFAWASVSIQQAIFWRIHREQVGIPVSRSAQNNTRNYEIFIVLSVIVLHFCSLENWGYLHNTLSLAHTNQAPPLTKAKQSIFPIENTSDPDYRLLCAVCVNAQLCTISRPDSPDIVWSAYVKMAKAAHP